MGTNTDRPEIVLDLSPPDQKRRRTLIGLHQAARDDSDYALANAALQASGALATDREGDHATLITWADRAVERTEGRGLPALPGVLLLKDFREYQRQAMTIERNFDLGALDAWASLNGGTKLPVLWGEDRHHLAYSRGRPTLIYGDDGAGKSNLAGLLIAGALALDGFETLLGYSVAALPVGESVLLLAFDGPAETRASYARLGLTAETPRLIVWGEAAPWDPDTADAGALGRLIAEIEEARGVRIGLVVVDNAFRAFGDVSRTDRAATFGNALNAVEAQGRAVIAMTQTKKNTRPTSLGDAMLGAAGQAGMGSTISLYKLAQGDEDEGLPTRSELRHHKGQGSDSKASAEVHFDLRTGRATLRGGDLFNGPDAELLAKVETLPEVGTFTRADAEKLWSLSTARAGKLLREAESARLIEVDHVAARGTKHYRRRS